MSLNSLVTSIPFKISYTYFVLEKNIECIKENHDNDSDFTSRQVTDPQPFT